MNEIDSQAQSRISSAIKHSASLFMIMLAGLTSQVSAQPVADATISAISGANQSISRSNMASGHSRAIFQPLTVSVKNPKGMPVAGATVTWSCAAPTEVVCMIVVPGGGISTTATTTTTDARGNSSLNKMSGMSVEAYDGDGVITVTASYGASRATFALTIAGLAKNTRVLKVLSGSPQTAVRLDGGTSAPGGIATFAPIVLQLTDSGSNPVGDAVVNFSCIAAAKMACQLGPSTGSFHSLRTRPDGTVTLSSGDGKGPLAYYASGNATIKVMADFADPINVQLTVNDPGPQTPNGLISIVAGDNQSPIRNTMPSGIPKAVFEPLTVLVTTPVGAPIPWATVNWSCSTPANMVCQFGPSGKNTLTTTADAFGKSTLSDVTGSRLEVSGADGAFSVNAAYGTARASFNMMVVPMGTSKRQLTFVSGRAQTVARTGTDHPGGTAKFAPVVVQVTDAFGRPVGGAEVKFTCQGPPAMACATEPSGAATSILVTGNDGKVTLKNMFGNSAWIYYASGAATLTVTTDRADPVKGMLGVQ
jgi:hypothetical protein